MLGFFEKHPHHTDALRRKLVIGGTVAVAAGLYVMHHKRVNTLLAMHQDAVYETMWSSFDEGVRYGLTLAKEGVTEAAQVGQYAFSAFDKTA